MAGERLSTSFCSILAVFLNVGCTVLGPPGEGISPRASATATVTAEAFLTQTYGAEVSSAIEDFESGWFSIEAHINPAVQSDIATGPYLEHFGYAHVGAALYDEPFWLVTTSAKVRKVRVVEYSPERFKAVASVARTYNKTTTEGEIIEFAKSDAVCAVYVFVREDQAWKLAGLFLTGGTSEEVAREWDLAPGWLKEIIGDLPDGELCLWFE